jgi:hypothetical protein
MIGLVHGFGVGIDMKPWAQAKGVLGGFDAFESLFAQKKAVIFDWRTTNTLQWHQFIGKKSLLAHYQAEKKIAKSTAVQIELAEFLRANHITTVVAHSLGCQLLLDTFSEYGLIDTIQKIVLVQGDFPAKHQVFLPNEVTLIERALAKKIQIINTFCPWDEALIFSEQFQKSRRAGQSGWLQPGIDNCFLPLKPWKQGHHTVLADTVLLGIIDE